MSENSMSENSHPENSYRVAVLVASVRKGRFAPLVADWFAAQAAARAELTVDTVDLAAIEYPGPDFSGPLAAADAVVIVTPEYNHSYPGHLKVALDSIGGELAAKPVAFVSYGGMSGGLRAVEALRIVLAELNATTIRETVSLHNAWDEFTADGEPKNATELNTAATVLLDQLTWWTRALHTARAAHPFGRS